MRKGSCLPAPAATAGYWTSIEYNVIFRPSTVGTIKQIIWSDVPLPLTIFYDVTVFLMMAALLGTG